MEKFSQFRDRGTQIAPFLPIKSPRPLWHVPFSIALYLIRFPIAFALTISYLAIIRWIPLQIFKKTCLWCVLLVSGLWYIDLQVEGVRKGNLAKESKRRLPSAGSVVICNHTSPIDAVYLAALFDPVFTVSYATSPKVQRIGILRAVIRTFSRPALSPPQDAVLFSVAELQAQYPNRIIALFPEGTTTNGRGILRFTPTLNLTPSKTPVFPISLRYTPADITCPIPHSFLRFTWSMLSKPGHSIRVRIGEKIYNHHVGNDDESSEEEEDEQSVICEKAGEALARLGRVKRLDLGIREKRAFVVAWKKRKL